MSTLSHLTQVYLRTLQELSSRQLVRHALEDGGWEDAHVLAVGKAAVPMAVAARRFCRGEGFVLTKHHHLDRTARGELEGYQVREAGHPVPDRSGIAATEQLLEWIRQRQGRLLVLLSGGTSALLVAPAPPLGLEELQELNRRLLASGWPIESINVVRKHLSLVKGGQMGQRLTEQFQEVRQLVLSDVCGPDIHGPDRQQRLLSLVGSGPTVADPSSREQAGELLERLDLPHHLLSACREALRETPDRLPFGAEVLADYEALAGKARELLGSEAMEPQPQAWPDVVSGDVRQLARQWADLARDLRDRGRQGVLVTSGEPTVVLEGEPGRGGRCQELALHFARHIAGQAGITLLCGSSDGTDGPTDYAGAVVNGQSWSAMQTALGHDPVSYLEAHDSTTALEAVPGVLLETGPTGQNLNDLFLLGIDGRGG